MFNSSTGKEFTLTKVLFMANANRNIVSEIRLKASECSFSDDGDKRHIFKKNGEILATARQGVNNSELFVFDKLVVIREATATTTEQYLNNDSQPSAASKLLHAHRRLGHLNFDSLRKMLNMTASRDHPRCDACELTKATQAKMQKVTSRPKAPRILHTIHSDIGFGANSEYIFQVVVDEYSRRGFYHELKSKDEALPKLMELVRKMENDKAPLKVAFWVTDLDSVYTSKAADAFRKEQGIEHITKGPYRHETLIERYMRTLGEKGNASMALGNAPKKEKGNAFQHTNYCMINSPHSSLGGASPISQWHGVKMKPSSRLDKGVLFCLAFGKIYDGQGRRKGDYKAFPSIYVGIDMNSNGYRLRSLKNGKIYSCNDVVFVMDSVGNLTFPYRTSIPSGMTPIDNDIADYRPVVLDHNSEDFSDQFLHQDNGDDDGDVEEPAPVRSSTRARELSSKALENIANSGSFLFEQDPRTWPEALQQKDANEWIKAGAEEQKNHVGGSEPTWVLVDRNRARGKKIFKERTVFKKKMLPPDEANPHGRIDRFKVRSTIAAFTRMLVNGVDYREKYAATPKWITTRFMLAMAAHFDLEIELNDVKAFFLTASLEPGEEICMEQPEMFHNGNHEQICKLVKAMYGLPQASHHAQQKMIDNFKRDSIIQTKSDRAVFLMDKEKGDAVKTAANVHVDDSLAVGSQHGLDKIRKSMARVFELKTTRNPTLVVGVQIERVRSVKWLKIHLEGYVINLLGKYNMLDSKIASTPMDAGIMKEKVEPCATVDTKQDLQDRREFQEVYGSLLWLVIKCRPDLFMVINYFGRCLKTARARELRLIKGQPLRYLNGTRNYGLVYCSGGKASLNGASDADFAGDPTTSRSTIGGYIKFGEYGLIYAKSSLQRKVMTSTGHSETAALESFCKENKALKVLAAEFGLQLGATACGVDNAGVVKQAINAMSSAQAKHYRVEQAFIRENVSDGLVRLENVASEENAADFFTKALGAKLFIKHRLVIMGPQEKPREI
jgi:hypothetical protein